MTTARYPQIKAGYEALPGQPNPYPKGSIPWDVWEAGRRMRELGLPLIETITHSNARKLLKGDPLHAASKEAAELGTARRGPRKSI
jgi:hypothetical protein